MKNALIKSQFVAYCLKKVHYSKNHPTPNSTPSPNTVSNNYYILDLLEQPRRQKDSLLTKLQLGFLISPSNNSSNLANTS